MISYVLKFDDAGSTILQQAGGKGANLARLCQGGFPVPPGFIVGTDAFSDHILTNKLGRLESNPAEIQAAIIGSPLSDAVRDEVLAAYHRLGDGKFVAVRSSGTAEDLAEASFAGMHDTYLDVRGDDDVLDAIRRCWASMWTARAVAYRRDKGFDYTRHRLAIVVLEMIASEVSGVMFTANPVSAAVDEFVINAAWGLGEGIVSGLVTPDELVVRRHDLQVRRRTLGSKELRIVRDTGSGRGTLTQPVPESDRVRFSLSDSQVAELAAIGASVMEHFDGWPQDIEWAWAGGRFYVLQSRDVTGVEFSWDEDLEAHGTLPPLRDDAVLSRARADTVWTGRITPLFYSMRSETRTLATPRMYGLWAGGAEAQRAWGKAGQEIGQLRWYKYCKGAVYFNSEAEYRSHLHVVPPALRNAALCEWTPPSWLQDLERHPGSWRNVVKVAARIAVLAPGFSLHRLFDSLHRLIERNAHGWGMEPDAIRRLNDAELKNYVQETLRVQSAWVRDIANAFYLHGPFMSACLLWMFENWYTGTNRTIYADLITGLPRQTWTVKQNEALWELAEKVRASAKLLALFREFEGARFFAEIENHEEGRRFLESYRAFLVEFGHRGQADRDLWYDRRLEDPGIDYRAFALLLQAGGRKVGAPVHELAARREAAMAEVLASIRKQPYGALKARLFAYAQRFMLNFFVFRDDSRHQTDRNTFAKKRAAQELGRRLVERGLLERDDDFYYLSKDELFELLDGRARSPRLVKAKVAGRRRNCDRYRREWSPPVYIRGDGSVYEEPGSGPAQVAGSGVLKGTGMSRGEAVGRAQIVPKLEDLHKLEKGDILVARGTDPSWTPAFIVLSGVVLETGGTLSHGACLAREYGIPAVQMSDAMSLITDGATIRVNGSTGEVRI